MFPVNSNESSLLIADLVAGGSYDIRLYTQTKENNNSTAAYHAHHLNPNPVAFNVSSLTTTTFFYDMQTSFSDSLLFFNIGKEKLIKGEIRTKRQ